MSTEDSRAALVEKLRESQDQYTQWLSAQPVSEILNHAMEFSMREEIIQAVDKYASFITDEQTAVLLETKDPLPDIWKAYKDRPGRANFIIECTGRIADMEIEKLARPDDRRTQSLSAEDIANGRIAAQSQRSNPFSNSNFPVVSHARHHAGYGKTAGRASLEKNHLRHNRGPGRIFRFFHHRCG